MSKYVNDNPIPYDELDPMPQLSTLTIFAISSPAICLMLILLGQLVFGFCQE
jgi:hypothetical protein